MESSAEKDAHGAKCACSWCVSERITYCALMERAPIHPDHHVPGCPARVTSPAGSAAWPCVTHGVAGCEKCWPRVTSPAAGGTDV